MMLVRKMGKESDEKSAENHQNQQKSQQILAIMDAGVEYSHRTGAEKIGLNGQKKRQLLNELVKDSVFKRYNELI